MKLEAAAVENVEATKGKIQRDTDGVHKRRGIWHYKLKVAGRWKEISTASGTTRKPESCASRRSRTRRKAASPPTWTNGHLRRPQRHGLLGERRWLQLKPIA